MVKQIFCMSGPVLQVYRLRERGVCIGEGESCLLSTSFDCFVICPLHSPGFPLSSCLLYTISSFLSVLLPLDFT